MSEKSRLPYRFLFFLFTIFMFLFILSSVSLLQFRATSFIPQSVFKLILVNSSSVYLKNSISKEPIKLPFFSSKQPSSVTDSESAEETEEWICDNPKGDFIRQHVEEDCDPSHALLRVYMYNLPPEFHFGLLGWRRLENEVWPNVVPFYPDKIPSYPGGLNLQHSMEYWLTLDLLASSIPNIIRPCTAIRVENSSQADVIFVPFFSSLSYNRHSKLRGKEKVSVNKMLQDKLVEFLLSQNEWKRFGGKDHLIVAHHPNSMLDARTKLGSAMFVLADFGRYPVEIANLKKDIIAPYKHVVKTIAHGESAPYDQRPMLVYFQGAIYRKDGGVIRQELYYLLKDEKDVHFAFGTIQGNGIKAASHGMTTSKFCLHIAGDTPSSNRLFDAIASNCVPVIISDDIDLPFQDVLDYSEFCVFVHSSDAVKKGYLLNLLRGIKREKWTKMWERLKEVSPHFEYRYPSRSGDAVDMIWKAVARKTSSLRFQIHRSNRYSRSQNKKVGSSQIPKTRKKNLR